MDAEQPMLFDDASIGSHHDARPWLHAQVHPPPPRDALGESLSHALQRTHISHVRSRTTAQHNAMSQAQHEGSIAAASASSAVPAASGASAAASGASSSLPSPSFASTHVGSDSDASSVDAAYSHSPSRYSHTIGLSLSPRALPRAAVDAGALISTATHFNRSESPMRMRTFAEGSNEPANEFMATASTAADLPPSFAAPESSPAIYRPAKSRRLTLPARVTFTSAAAAGAESRAHEHAVRARTPDTHCADDTATRLADEDVRAAVRSAFFAPAASSSSSSTAAASSSAESGPSCVLRSLARHGAMDLPFFAQIRATILGFAGEDNAVEITPSRGSHGAGSAPHSGVKLRTRTIRTPTKEVAPTDDQSRLHVAPLLSSSVSSALFSQQPRSHSATAATPHTVSMDQSPHQLVHPHLQHAATTAAAAAASSPIAHSRHASPLPLLVLTRPKRRRTADDIEAVSDDSAASAPFVPFLSGLPSLIAPFSPRSSVVPFGSSSGAAEQSAGPLSARSHRVVLRYRVRTASPQVPGQSAGFSLKRSAGLHDALGEDSMHTCSPLPQSRRRAPLSADAAAAGFVSPSLFPTLFSSLSSDSASASSAHQPWRSSESITLCTTPTTLTAAASHPASAAPSLRVLQQQAQFWRAEQ